MSSVLQGGTKRRRRSGPVVAAIVVVVAAGIAVALIAGGSGGGGGGGKPPLADVRPAVERHIPQAHPGQAVRIPPPGIVLGGKQLVKIRLRPKPGAALMFDLDTGRVLWQLRPLTIRPIASVTKIMTALLVVERLPHNAKAMITKDALHYTGSEVGVLPLGKEVPVQALLYGLLLPSGNDAAVALADRIAGSDRKFAQLMNQRASQLHLTCTHFSSSYGLQKGNRSCAADLAALARIAMSKPQIAHIVGHRHVNIRFPIKHGHLDLYSTNPLLRMNYPGTIGLKTGYTDPAGRCLVAIVRRGGHTLGVVLLHSYYPAGQAMQLFKAGFGTLARAR
jgi:serine-type D-Ala-D-Ala carboxypeptidase (penicillin-binding protein 5/6)